MKPIVAAGTAAAAAGATEQAPPARRALGSLALAMLLASLGVSIPNVALPTLADAFAAPFHAVQWIIIAYLLAVTILIVGAGRLGDVLGHRRVLLGGILLFTAASILCGAAPTLWPLIAARAAQGAGAAILMALTVALVRDSVPKDRTGSAMGLLGTMSAIGTALGPSLGGLLVAGPGWRAIFLIMAPLGVLNFLLAQRSLPAGGKTVKRERQSFDGPGMLLLGLALAAYALAMTVGDGGFGWFNIALLSAAGLAGGLFLLAETKAASPLIQLTAFRSGVLSAGLVMNGLVSTVMMATLVVGPFYLSRALGLDAAAVGLVMSIGPVISALSGLPAGRIVDRLGAPVMVIAGLAAMAAGSVGLAVLPGLLGLAGYIAAIAVLTPGYQLFQAANNTAVMADVGADRRGVVSGLLSLSRNLGLITGASAMGAIFAAAAATADFAAARPETVASGLRITFAVTAALVAIALILAAGSRAAAAQGLPKAHTLR